MMEHPLNTTRPLSKSFAVKLKGEWGSIEHLCRMNCKARVFGHNLSLSLPPPSLDGQGYIQETAVVTFNLSTAHPVYTMQVFVSSGGRVCTCEASHMSNGMEHTAAWTQWHIIRQVVSKMADKLFDIP